MKNTAKFLHGIFIVVTLFLTSCGNKQDFAYNEKITHDFYSCKERLDERHEELLDGKYDIDKSDQMRFDMEIKSVNTFKDFVSETKTTANELNHSEVANKFHANTISYMSKIADEYAPLLIDYVNEQDSVKKLEIMQKLKTKKFELETLENKCLESQIEFLNKAGIKINPNQ